MFVVLHCVGSLHLHGARVVPVELLAGDGESSAHALEDLADLLVHLLNPVLVHGFSFVDSCDDVFGVGLRQGNTLKALLETEVNIAILEVVVVDLDGAGEGASLRVDEPAGLPLAAPERREVRVDAADVDLQVSVLVEAQAGARRALSVVLSDVGINGSLNARLVRCPLLVELLGEVAHVAKHGRLERVRVERELDAKL